MNLGNGKESMSTASSGGAWKAAEPVSDQFPAGLRVMVVDDDPTCLMILEKMLKTCLYEVTKCTRAEMALSLLRENKNGYDVVISDVHMPDMDGFKLLEHIGLEMDLPVISKLLSGKAIPNSSGLLFQSVDQLFGTVTGKAIPGRLLVGHIARILHVNPTVMSADDGKNVVMKGVTHGACDYLIKPVRIEALRNIWQHVVRKKRNEWKDLEQSGSVEEGDRGPKQSEDADYSSSANEGNWRNPKRRKEEDDEAEERDDSSTLKKPRVVWSVELHQQFVQAVNQLGIDKAVPKKILELMNVPGLTRENVASHLQKYRLYLRRLSGVSQHSNSISNGYMTPQETVYGPLSSLNGLDLQALAAAGQLPAQSLAIQAAGIARPPVKSRVPIPVVDQRNLFSFENPKLRFADQQPPPQLGNSNSKINLLHGIPTSLHHPSQSLIQLNPNGALNNQLPIQISQPQSQSRVSSLQSPILANSIAGVRAAGPAGYNFPANSAAELAASRFQLASANSGIKPSYDVFSELTQQKSHDWELDNILQGHLDIEQNRNLSGAAKPMFSGDATNQMHPQSMGQNVSTFFGGNPVRVKSELVTDSNLFPEHFEQDDLMSALLKQQQGAVGSGENEFDFDGYPLDNVV